MTFEEFEAEYKAKSVRQLRLPSPASSELLPGNIGIAEIDGESTYVTITEDGRIVPFKDF